MTLASVGAGALGAALVVVPYPLRMTPQRLVGTDVVHAIPPDVLAGLGHLTLGTVDVPLLGLLLVGSIPAVVFGVSLGSEVPQRAARCGLGRARDGGSEVARRLTNVRR